MRIVIAELPDGVLRLSGSTELPLQAAGEDPDRVTAVGPVGYALAVRQGGGVVTVEGQVTATVEVDCSRCAGRVRMAVDRPFAARFVAAEEGAATAAHELDGSDLDLDYYRDGAIDGLCLLAEQIFLDLPMKPLCRDDCKGVCPVCGGNLNQADCGCDGSLDPRWATLKSLRNRL